MASDIRTSAREEPPSNAPRSGEPSHAGDDHPLGAVLQWMASLKISVALFAMLVFLVFVGTLAQAQLGLWDVVDHYFRSFIAFIEFRVLFPPSFMPDGKPWDVPGGFFFPGGWLLGLLLTINLLAAHAVRFKLQAGGGRALAGAVLMAAGAIVTFLVIQLGNDTEGVHYTSRMTSAQWDGVWYGFLVVMGVGGLLTAAAAAVRYAQSQGNESPGAGAATRVWLPGVCGVVLLALSAWLLYLQVTYPGGAGRLNDSSMRILWQLAKGLLASLVLFAGCYLLFRKRAGIVLLHLGVLLIMFGELLVGLKQTEARLTVREGETKNFVESSIEAELAVIDPSDLKTDHVVAIPASRLEERGEIISDERLPFDIEVERFYPNSEVQWLAEGEKGRATAGSGKSRRAVEKPPEPGTESRSDMPSVYVRVREKDTGKPLATVLASYWLEEQPVTVDGVSYRLDLRGARTYLPYAVFLQNVDRTNYLGTETPKDYSSYVKLLSEDDTVDRPVRIWMNNPLRYKGQTLFQSGYHLNAATGLEQSSLQIVSNVGWMIPYVGCMMVGTGMLYHFSVVLGRFSKLRAKESATRDAGAGPEVFDAEIITEDEPARLQAAASPPPPKRHPPRSRPTPAGRGGEMLEAGGESTRSFWEFLPPAVVVSLALGLLGMMALPKPLPEDGFDLKSFGQLPVVYEGRVKPFDTLARNSLQIIADTQSFKEKVGEDEDGDPVYEKRSATRWLLDVITGRRVPTPGGKPGETTLAAAGHRVFRIHSPQVQELLGLTPRKGHRYALDEFEPRLDAFVAQLTRAQQMPKADWTDYEREIIELSQRMERFRELRIAFAEMPIPRPPTREEAEADQMKAARRLMRIREMLARAKEMEGAVLAEQPPLAAPMPKRDKETDEQSALGAGHPGWEPYAVAWPKAYLLGIGEENPQSKLPALALKNIFDAYRAQDATRFNRAVASYQADLPYLAAKDYEPGRVKTETFFNSFAPFEMCAALYVFAFLLVMFSFLATAFSSGGGQRALYNSALALVVLTFVAHTVALGLRMYISGRPPVTNLYSSAVFVGWAGVLLGIIFESVYRYRAALVTACVVGFGSLLVAAFLSRRGDTIVVMQAVLDTGFWLATHVVAISFGYSATFAAGALGMALIAVGAFVPGLPRDVERVIARMIYGTLCFAIFFSFIGTVLGGLWADDSWGRFWGWDPKENGALMIVLWNALVLHARFGGLVKSRGLAALAVFGNIVTAWSWFGTNELGVGLHSYGFTEGVLLALAIFVASQLSVIALGMLGCFSHRMWLSDVLPERRSAAPT